MMKFELTNSLAVTDGIRVNVQSKYLPEQSAPREQRYVFTYSVQLRNEGKLPAQLRSRHWIITDGAGEVEEVRGPGVVGQHPHLEPGEQFEYSSYCVLPTPRGEMRGSYQMLRDDGGVFDVAIAPFALAMPLHLN